MQYSGHANAKILLVSFLKSQLTSILYFYLLSLAALPDAMSCSMTLSHIPVISPYLVHVMR